MIWHPRSVFFFQLLRLYGVWRAVHQLCNFTTRFTFFSIALLSLSQHITQLYEPYKRISNEMSSLIEFNKRVDWDEDVRWMYTYCRRCRCQDGSLNDYNCIYCMILSTYTSFVSMKLNQRLDWWTEFTLKRIESKIMWLVGCFFHVLQLQVMCRDDDDMI